MEMCLIYQTEFESLFTKIGSPLTEMRLMLTGIILLT